MKCIKYITAVCALSLLACACLTNHTLNKGERRHYKIDSFRTEWVVPFDSLGMKDINRQLLIKSSAVLWDFNKIVSLKRESGQLAWQISLKSGQISGAIAAGNNRLLVSVDLGYIYLVNIDSGAYVIKNTNIQGLTVVCCNKSSDHVVVSGWDEEQGVILASYNLLQNNEQWRIKMKKNTKIVDTIVFGDYVGLYSYNNKDGRIFIIIDVNDGSVKYSIKPKYKDYSVNAIDRNNILIFSANEVQKRPSALRNIINLRHMTSKYIYGSEYCDGLATLVKNSVLYNVYYNPLEVVASDLYSGKVIWRKTTANNIYSEFYIFSALYMGNTFIIADLDGFGMVFDIADGKVLYQVQNSGGGYATKDNDILIVNPNIDIITLLRRN